MLSLIMKKKEKKMMFYVEPAPGKSDELNVWWPHKTPKLLAWLRVKESRAGGEVQIGYSDEVFKTYSYAVKAPTLSRSGELSDESKATIERAVKEFATAKLKFLKVLVQFKTRLSLKVQPADLEEGKRPDHIDVDDEDVTLASFEVTDDEGRLHYFLRVWEVEGDDPDVYRDKSTIRIYGPDDQRIVREDRYTVESLLEQSKSGLFNESYRMVKEALEQLHPNTKIDFSAL